jgi:hypothetical protein
MAAWVLEVVHAALDAAEEMAPRVRARLGVEASEQEHWAKLAGSPNLPVRRNGTLDEFEGFERLRAEAHVLNTCRPVLFSLGSS